MPPLPPLDGVDPCRVVLPPGPWLQLGEFLLDHFPQVPEPHWRERLQTGRAVDGDGRQLYWQQPYRAGGELHYYRELSDEVHIPFQEKILYQDEDLLVADKPHFLPVVPAGRFLRETLLVRLRQTTGIAELTPLHRLDRLTAGLVLFSCREASRGAYVDLFRQRKIRKVYEAIAPLLSHQQWPVVRHSRIVAGEPFFRMAEVEGVANAQTQIALAAVLGSQGRYRLEPLTGRKHQLRLHMAGLGVPICGDPLYPALQSEPAPDDFSTPMQLLAQVLEFTDPLSGQQRRFESLRALPG